MISLIAAIGKNNELGKDNKLLWSLPNDLKFFKNVTNNHTVVMGYNTFESIGRILPNRRNIIITHKDIKIDGAIIYHSFDEVIEKELNSNDEIFIIGGASLYSYFYNLADRLYLTEIDDEADADVFFPDIDKIEWEREIINDNEENKIKYKHVLYKRLK